MSRRMPKKGECWRHYKGTLYVVDFVSIDEESGFPRVQYHAAVSEHLVQGPEMYHGRLLHVFLGFVPETHERRFTFERESY